jgi:hypothetical protein
MTFVHEDAEFDDLLRIVADRHPVGQKGSRTVAPCTTHVRAERSQRSYVTMMAKLPTCQAWISSGARTA